MATTKPGESGSVLFRLLVDLPRALEPRLDLHESVSGHAEHVYKRQWRGPHVALGAGHDHFGDLSQAPPRCSQGWSDLAREGEAFAAAVFRLAEV